MIRLAFSTNAFKKNTLPEAVDAIAAIGYRGVEIMADAPHADPFTFDEPRRVALGRQVDSLGLAVSNVNAFTGFACGDTYHPTWIEHGPAMRQWRVDHATAAVDLAFRLNCKTVSLQPGGPLIGTGLSREEAAARFAAGLRQVLPAARRVGVTLAIEPEPGLLIQTADEYQAFKRDFFADEPQVKMNCDVGHLFCVGDDPAAVIRSMPEEVAHVHLEDIGKNRVHQHLTPGRGAIDFPPIFAALEEVGYGGWATVELYPYESDAAGVAAAAWEHLGPMV